MSAVARMRVALAALALCVAGAWLMQALSPSSPSATAQSGSAAPLDGPLGRYSVFGRAATASDDISAWHIPPSAITALGLNTARARLVFADSTRKIAAVAAAQGPCLVQQLANGHGHVGCGGDDRTTIAMGYHGAVGVVPDSVKSVTFTMTDGTTQTALVVDNTWQSPDEATKVSIELPGKTEVEELMPLSSVPKGATLHADGLVTADGAAPPLN